MADLGQAYVQIVASAEGISNSITSVLDPEATKAGESSGKKLSDSLGKSFSSAGGTLTKTLTAPILGVGAAAVAGWKGVDEGLDTIVTKTGASGEALEAMHRSMENIATTIPTDFATAGAAIGEVNTRFGLTGQELESLSTKFVEFAALNETDVSGAVDATQKALSAFGLGAEDAGALLDRMNSVGQATGISMDSLMSGLTQNAAAFNEMGVSIDQAAEFMGKAEMSGADMNTVMGGLQKAMKNAAADGVPLNEALANLQDTILNGSDGVDGLTASYDLFGKSGAQIYEAVKNGTIDFQDLTAAVGDAGNSVEDTFNDTLDPMDQFKTVMNELGIAGAELVEVVGPILADALTTLTDIIKDGVDWWRNLDEGQQKMILTVVGVIAAIGPLLGILGTVISTVSMVSGAIGLIASPVGIAVLAIGGLIAAGVAIYENWDAIKEAAGNLKDSIAEKTEAIKTGVSEKWESLKSSVSEKAETIKNSAGEKFSTLKENASNTFENLKSSASDKLGSMRDTASNIFDAVKGLASFNWSLPSLGTGVLDDAMSAARNAVDSIKGFFNFDWSLPNLKLPHISVDEYIDVPGLGTIPAPWGIHVDWYRKAYDEPWMFDRETIVPTGSGLKGFGDGPGGEIVYGRDNLMRDIRDAAGGGQRVFAPVINIYTQEGQSNEEIAQYVMDKMNFEYGRADKVFA